MLLTKHVMGSNAWELQGKDVPLLISVMNFTTVEGLNQARGLYAMVITILHYLLFVWAVV